MRAWRHPMSSVPPASVGQPGSGRPSVAVVSAWPTSRSTAASRPTVVEELMTPVRWQAPGTGSGPGPGAQDDNAGRRALALAGTTIAVLPSDRFSSARLMMLSLSVVTTAWRSPRAPRSRKSGLRAVRAVQGRHPEISDRRLHPLHEVPLCIPPHRRQLIPSAPLTGPAAVSLLSSRSTGLAGGAVASLPYCGSSRGVPSWSRDGVLATGRGLLRGSGTLLFLF